MPVDVTLPLPPSVNHMYRPGSVRGKRYKTDNCKAWEEKAGKELLPYSRYFRMYKPPYQYEAWFYFPDARRRDADNLIKPLQDLVSRIYNFDDKEITDFVIHKRIDRDNPRCEISLWGEV